MESCSLCNVTLTAEEPAILTVGAYGIPRYLCDDCAQDLDDMTSARDLDRIAAAFDKVGAALASNPHSDGAVNRTMTALMKNAKERAERIKDGTYDFAEDNADDDVPDDIPEELRESEEDAMLDKRDEEAAKKIDKVTNVIFALVLAAFLVFGLIKLLG